MKQKIFEFFRRFLAISMALMMFLCATATPAYADDASVDTSFYKLASVASGFFATARSKNEGDYVLPSNHSFYSGNAGGLLGYSDNADESGLIQGWIMSSLSGSSATFSYESLEDINSSNVSASNKSPYWKYAQKGRALRLMGLDATGTETSWNIGRMISGNLLKFVYLATTTVDALFDMVIGFLTTINPFRFFKDPNVTNSAILTEGGVAAGFTGGGYYIDDTTNPELQQLAANIQSVYAVIYNNRLLILGTLLAVLAFSLAISKGGNGWQKIRKFLIRACSITIAIPLLASFYTSCLGWMSNASQNSQEASARIVLSTLVDFEHWARDCHLALPTYVQVKEIPGTSRLALSDPAQRNLRAITYAINTATQRNGSGGASASVGNSYGDTGTHNALFDWYGGGAISEGRATVDYTLDVLDRYTAGTFYYASSFESDEKAGLEYEDPFKETIDKTGTTVAKFAESASTMLVNGTRWKNADVTVKNSDGNVNVWTNGDDVVGASSSGDSIGLYSNACLSTMAMYNYLTSSFTDSSVVVYSSEKAPSGFVRQSHYSVNLVGTGMMSFLYWLNAVVVLGASVIIGWFYALALFMSAIKRMVLLISATPFALLGSLRSIARVIIYAIAMIAEVCMTMIAYYIVVAILNGLNTLVEQPFVDTMINNAANPPTIILGGQPAAIGSVFAALLMVSLLVSTVITVVFVFMSMKVRNSLVKFVDELVTETVDAFIGVKSGADPGGSSSLASKAAAGIGAGVGAGLAHKAATSTDNKATSHGDTQGVAVNKDKSDGGNPAIGDGSDKGGPDGGGPAALAAGDEAGSGDTTIQNDTSISDDDTATAEFDGIDSDDAAEIDAAAGMVSLADGNTEEVSTEDATAVAAAGGDGADGDVGEAGAADAKVDAADAQAQAEADGTVETVDDQQQAAADMSTGETPADSDAQGDGAVAAGVAGGSGSKNDSDGKTNAVGANKQGQSQQGVVKSNSVDEAMAKNADAKKRLAQARADAAQAGLSSEQISHTVNTAAAAGKNGQSGAKPGAKPIATTSEQGGKPVAGAVGVKPVTGTPGNPAVVGEQAAAGSISAGAVPGAVPDSGVNPIAAAPEAGVIPGAVIPGVPNTAGGQQTQNAVGGGVVPGAIPGVAQGVQPVAGAAGMQGAIPGGAPGAVPAGFVQTHGVVTPGVPGSVGAGDPTQPMSVVAGGVTGQPSVTAGPASVVAGPGVTPVGGQPAGIPAGAIPIQTGPNGVPTAVNQPVGQGQPGAVVLGGQPGAVPGHPAAQGVIPGSPAAVQQGTAPSSGKKPGQVNVIGQPGAQGGQSGGVPIQPGPVQQPGGTLNPSGSGVKRQASVSGTPAGGGTYQERRVETTPNGSVVVTDTSVKDGVRTTFMTVDGPDTKRSVTTVEHPDGTSYTHKEAVYQPGGFQQSAPTPAPAPVRQQPSAMKTAAAAAMAAFLAASDNPVVSGVGSGLQAGQMAGWVRAAQGPGGSPQTSQQGGGTPIYEYSVMEYSPGTPGGEAAVINTLDSETAQIEAQIAALQAQTMTALAKKKSLPSKTVDEVK